MVNERMYFELRRKLLHSLFGLFLIAILYYYGQKILVLFLSALLVVGSLMIIWRLNGRRIPIGNWFEETFEREGVRFPGYGAFWYVVGTLILVLLIQDASEIAAAIVVLAAGDSAATIFGLNGVHPLPYNERKTVEGSIAFFIFSIPCCLFVGWTGLLLAVWAAVAESLLLPFDDNLAIPVASIIFFLIAGLY
jgi:dolichol kinase